MTGIFSNMKIIVGKVMFLMVYGSCILAVVSAVCTPGVSDKILEGSSPYDYLGGNFAYSAGTLAYFCTSPYDDICFYQESAVSMGDWIALDPFVHPTRTPTTYALQDSTMLVGDYDDDEFGYQAGAVYIIHESSPHAGDWANSAIDTIHADDIGVQLWFGYRVAMSGTNAAISGRGYGIEFDGCVYLFKESVLGLGDYVQTHQFYDEASGYGNDYMGSVIALDGRLLAAPVSDNGAHPTLMSGFVFVWAATSPDHGDWAPQPGPVPDGESLPNSYGTLWNYGVAIALKESILVVGASSYDTYGTNAGVVFVFEELVEGGFLQVAKFSNSDAEAQDNFGSVLSLNANMLLVGVSAKSSQTGAVYVFSTDSWEEMAKLVPTQADVWDRCGSPVLAREDESIVLGCHTSDAGSLTGVGSIYVYPALNCDYCSSDPCTFGVCEEAGLAGFICDCQNTGYEGDVCQTNIDDCMSSPCQHSGMCNDAVLSFACDCQNTGYEGDLCESDVDDCSSSPCLNNGVCTDTGVNMFTCNCAGTGFEGDICTSDVDDCLSSPCMNNGICTDAGSNAFSCDCTSTGFEGDICTRDVDDCQSSPCQNSGICSDLGIHMYVCDCEGTGYESILCDREVDDCVSSPCLNAGLCVDTGANTYSCDCIGTGFAGATCEEDVDDCLSSPCENGGACSDAGVQAYACDCQDTGYAGTHCESLQSSCLSMPCQNGGNCTSSTEIPTVFSCNCASTNFGGALCDTVIVDGAMELNVSLEFTNLAANVNITELVKKLPDALDQPIIVQSISVPLFYPTTEFTVSGPLNDTFSLEIETVVIPVYRVEDAEGFTINIQVPNADNVTAIDMYDRITDPDGIVGASVTDLDVVVQGDTVVMNSIDPDDGAGKPARSDDEDDTIIIIVACVGVLVMAGLVGGYMYFSATKGKNLAEKAVQLPV